MNDASVTLTVFYEGQFYVGLLERTAGNALTVSRIVFGAEPKDGEVQAYLLENYRTLPFSPPVEADGTAEKRINPKRMQREIRREIDSCGVGTKSQQALKLLREENKLVRKTVSRAQREAEKEEAFRLRSEKRKEKHRGH